MLNLNKIEEYLLEKGKFDFSRDSHYVKNKTYLHRTCISIYFDNRFVLEKSFYEIELLDDNPITEKIKPKEHNIFRFDELKELIDYLAKNTIFSESDFPYEFIILRSQEEIEEIKSKLKISRIEGSLTSGKRLSINRERILNGEKIDLFGILRINNDKYEVNIEENPNKIDEGLLECDFGYIRNERKSFTDLMKALDYLIGSTDVTEEDFPNKYNSHATNPHINIKHPETKNEITIVVDKTK